MNELGSWLRAELVRRGLTQSEVAAQAGVGPATLSDVLNKGHVPKAETLFRLADYFETSRAEILRLAGHLPQAGKEEGAGASSGTGEADAALIGRLLDEFRQVPDEWKLVAIEQVAQYRRLAELRPAHVIGEVEDDASPLDETSSNDEAEASAQAA